MRGADNARFVHSPIIKQLSKQLRKISIKELRKKVSSPKYFKPKKRRCNSNADNKSKTCDLLLQGPHLVISNLLLFQLL